MALEVMWQSNPPEKQLKERFHISTGFHPGQRDSANFPIIRLSERMLSEATHFLDEIFCLVSKSSDDR